MHVVHGELGGRNAVADQCLAVRPHRWVAGGLQQEFGASWFSGETTGSQRCSSEGSPRATSCFFSKPSTFV
ncbi:hypothetical protein HNR07_001718 [Nocardiopsis metallicus]|uniref:Uncharacterized protein n=1 Tax=Nocardiopsis metallicus TaxID=179819 RepID=A0A840WC29_9ACTN|nr:hypothetical protein [Nocardiopsis metallicus]